MDKTLDITEIVATIANTMDTTQKQFFSVPEFCASHSISRGHFYRLMKDGMAPAIIKVGKRTLISAEAAADWRRRMEQAAEEYHKANAE